jgi:hypothetical protein
MTRTVHWVGKDAATATGISECYVTRTDFIMWRLVQYVSCIQGWSPRVSFIRDSPAVRCTARVSSFLRCQETRLPNRGTVTVAYVSDGSGRQLTDLEGGRPVFNIPITSTDPQNARPIFCFVDYFTTLTVYEFYIIEWQNEEPG